ncbi:MAG: hypothetical protein IJH52_07540 [Oscillospiraceae bacterium]|nr:hypothetical protein [Oscillospiraceae bacterium]
MIGQLTSTATPFQAGQSIRVYFPENFDAGGIEKGAAQFISFCGKDCDGAAGTVHAVEISAYNGN